MELEDDGGGLPFYKGWSVRGSLIRWVQGWSGKRIPGGRKNENKASAVKLGVFKQEGQAGWSREKGDRVRKEGRGSPNFTYIAFLEVLGKLSSDSPM